MNGDAGDVCGAHHHSSFKASPGATSPNRSARAHFLFVSDCVARVTCVHVRVCVCVATTVSGVRQVAASSRLGASNAH